MSELQWNRTVLHSHIMCLSLPCSCANSVNGFVMSHRFFTVLVMKPEAATTNLNFYEIGDRFTVYDIVDKRVLTVSIFEGGAELGVGVHECLNKSNKK